jgi:hypothetical protein
MKPTFDKPSAKYKKDNAHTKSRQNQNVQKVKLELPVSPCQVNVSVAGRRGDSKQSESSSKTKLHSRDCRQRKFHTIMPFPPFRHPMSKPSRPSPMMFHPYASWFGWYAPPMQYESFYLRSVKHAPNEFDSLAHPRKDRFYPKSRSNATKNQEQPNRTVRFRNLDAQDKKLIFANDKKQQQSADMSSGARIGGHELEKELCPRVVASKPTGQNTEPKDNVPTSFDKTSRHVSKAVGKIKKMMWVPTCSTPIKAGLITRTSTARIILKSEPHMTSKVLLSKHMNKKADP